MVLASAATPIDVEDPNKKNYTYHDYDDDNIGSNTINQKIYDEIDIDQFELIDKNDKNIGDFVEAKGNGGDAGDNLDWLAVENGLFFLNKDELEVL